MFKALPTFLRFSVAGAIGFVADTAVLYAVKDVAGLYVGRLISFVAAVTVTWLINRNFAFAEAKGQRSIWAEYALYFVSMLGGGTINYLVYAGLVASVELVRVHPILGIMAGTAVGLGVNFTLSKKVVFAQRKDKSS